MTKTNLTGANFSNAVLRYADLSKATLSKTNLNGADLSLAIMPNGTTVYGTAEY
jgi:uncharacterized protein YjbI with pentapeptide repeats